MRGPPGADRPPKARALRPLRLTGDSSRSRRRRPRRRRGRASTPATSPATVPDEVVVERPKNPRARRLRHQRRAAAGQAGRPAAARGRRGHRRRGCARPTASPRSTSPARASSTSPSPPARSAQLARDDRRGRRRTTAAPTTLAGQRINLEFVSANPTGPVHIGGTRWAAVGDALARLLEAQRRRASPASTTSTTHGAQIDRFARSLLAARQGRARARGRLRRRLHRRDRRGRSSPRTPTSSTLPDDEAQEVFRARRRRADVRRDQAVAARLRRRLRRLLPRELAARVRGGRQGRRTSCKEPGTLY